MKYQYLIFDLDGTLSDPESGITNCVKYALLDQGIKEENQELLKLFIGPPLEESFIKYYHMTKEQADQAVIKYRERFRTIGMFENVLFEDTIEVLSTLKEHGYQLCIATSKPEMFAIPIVKHFKIDQYFTIIKGAIGNRNAKQDIIHDVLEQIDSVDLSSCLMVGDRKHDIIGAKENHIDVAALECGFAPEGEFEEYGATYIFKNLTALKEFLL